MAPKAFQIPCNAKQLEVIRSCNPRIGKPEFQLVSGPRLCGKSTGALHAIVNHAWNVNHASISVTVPTVSMGEDGGIWTLLTDEVVPLWIDGGFGMEWITTPKQKGTTKKLYFKITNKFGTASSFQLDSLQHEDEVENKFKGKQHSCIYVGDASYFKNRKFFDTVKLCLRGSRWSHDAFLLLLDTNPAEEGEDSWLWQIWYNERLMQDVDVDTKELQKQFHLIEFTIDDNTYLSQKDKNQLKAGYAHSEDLLARYYYGKWVKATGNSVFAQQFRPNFHIVGEHETRSNPDPETLLPSEQCAELKTGWDIGTGPNSSFHIAEKCYEIRDGKPVSVFNFLDEVTYVGSEKSMTEFVQECISRVQFWEEWMGHAVQWMNWSDRSAFDNRERIANVYHHQLVAYESNNKIILTAADRSPGSVLQRVQMMRKLLFENRVFISRSRCPNLIDSLQSIRKGKGNAALDQASKYKHALDSATYLVVMECFDEIIRPNNQLNSGKTQSSLVCVPL